MTNNIDDLIHDAVFAPSAAAKEAARSEIRRLAAEHGIFPASIRPFYEEMAKGTLRPFTVPAFNLRTLTYDVARAAFRVAKRHQAGAFIFEIARSEMSYTGQPPAEYAACILAAAIKEGYRGPVFIQGDHFQVSAKKWATPELRAGEIKAIEALVEEAIAAGFWNIDIDASTLVNLDLPTRDEQQRDNYETTAHFVRFIRQHEPAGVTVSVGGEIGEVGKHNTQPDEVRAYMAGLLKLIGGLIGISKLSVQTGTSHGGVPLADGTIAEVKLDFGVLSAVTDICRVEFGMAGSVQHGASTLPESVFNRFPEAKAAEIHLATGFQNMILDAAEFPAALKERIGAYCFEHLAAERKEGDTDEQFVYKARKKAMGPLKQDLWDMDPAAKTAIMQTVEAKFEFLMDKLGVFDTAQMVLQAIPAPQGVISGVVSENVANAARDIDPNEGE